jgi:enoyl reductase-like protein
LLRDVHESDHSTSDLLVGHEAKIGHNGAVSLLAEPGLVEVLVDHKIATRAVKLWREFDDTVFAQPRDKRAAWLEAKKDYVIDRLNKDFNKPWFGQKADGTVELSPQLDSSSGDLVNWLSELWSDGEDASGRPVVGALPFVSGDWSVEQFGLQPMPFDGVLYGSRVMVAKEADTSPSVKQLIVEAPGVDDQSPEM